MHVSVAQLSQSFQLSTVSHRNFNLIFVQPALSSKIIMLSHLIAVYHVKIRKDSFELAWIKVAFMCTSNFQFHVINYNFMSFNYNAFFL